MKYVINQKRLKQMMKSKILTFLLLTVLSCNVLGQTEVSTRTGTRTNFNLKDHTVTRLPIADECLPTIFIGKTSIIVMYKDGNSTYYFNGSIHTSDNGYWKIKSTSGNSKLTFEFNLIDGWVLLTSEDTEHKVFDLYFIVDVIDLPKKIE